jgi:type IV pilus assembly protein PilM
MATRLVGLDIGHTGIRGAEVESHGDTSIVTRYAEVPLPDGAIVNGEVVTADTVSAALTQLWALGKFRTRQVALGVGGQRLIIRQHTIARVPRNVLQKTLRFQISDILPVDAGTAILDFYPVQDVVQDTTPMVKGLLVAATEDTVMGYVKAINAAKLHVASVDLSCFAALRAIEPLDRRSSETIAYIDLGGSTTTIVVAVRGVPVYGRIIGAGGEDITAKLAQQFDLPIDQARDLKQQTAYRPLSPTAAFAPAGQERPDDVLAAAYDTLLNSIEDTLSYYSNAEEQYPITSLRLYGRTSRQTGLLDAIQVRTGYPVYTTDVLTTVTTRDVDTELKVRESLDVAPIAIGLGMRTD